MRTAHQDAITRLLAQRTPVCNESAPKTPPIIPPASSHKDSRPLTHQRYPEGAYAAERRDGSRRRGRVGSTRRRTRGRLEPVRPGNQPDQAPTSSGKVSRALTRQRYLESTYAVEREG